MLIAFNVYVFSINFAVYSMIAVEIAVGRYVLGIFVTLFSIAQLLVDKDLA